MKLEVTCRHRFDSGFEAAFDFVSDHRAIALFGPSGAGKTSLLMMVAGFVTPTTGHIAWGGRILFDSEARIALAPEARRLGVVFQDQRLFPHLSVEANLRFGRRRSDNKHAAAPPFDRMVAVLELEPLLTRGPGTLSGGERQRVALGRALMSSPDLLLLDEPVAAVDEPHRETILRYVDRVVDEWNVPMVYVSHHRSEVQRLADWVVAVDQGRVIEQGPPDKVLGTGAVVAAGEPINLIRLAEVTGDAENGWFGVVATAESALRVRLPSGQVSASGSIFVQFAASDVMLARGDTTGLSARNRLPARVTEIVPRSGRAFVALQIGEQRLWAEVTDDAVADLGLRGGVEVTCLIKTAALRVVE